MAQEQQLYNETVKATQTRSDARRIAFQYCDASYGFSLTRLKFETVPASTPMHEVRKLVAVYFGPDFDASRLKLYRRGKTSRIELQRYVGTVFPLGGTLCHLMVAVKHTTCRF